MKAVAAVLAALVAVGVLMYVYTAPADAPAEMTEAEIAQIEAEVKQFAEDWFDVWRGNDCEPSRDLIHPERWVRIYDGKPNSNVDEWMARCVTTLANRASFSANWIDTEVRVMSPDAAVLIGTSSSTFEYNDGTPARHYPINSTIMIVERTDSGWRLSNIQMVNGPYEAVEEG